MDGSAESWPVTSLIYSFHLLVSSVFVYVGKLFFRFHDSIRDAGRLLEDTKVMARAALEEATKAYTESLRLLTDAEGINVPMVDSEELQKEAHDIKTEVRIKSVGGF